MITTLLDQRIQQNTEETKYQLWQASNQLLFFFFWANKFERELPHS